MADYQAKPTWWKNNPVTKIQKSNVTNKDISVLPDTHFGPVLEEVQMGPKKVFKQGYPTSQTVGVAGSMNVFEPTQTTHVKTSRLLDLHGVADSSQIAAIMHPSSLSLLDSLIRQEAFLVTEDMKVIDVAAHSWPIDLLKATDARTKLRTPVKYGDELGIVAGCTGELVMFRNRSGTKQVSFQDLEIVPGKIMRRAGHAFVSGDKVMTRDGMMVGEVVGESDWKGEEKLIRVKWNNSGAIADVKSEEIVGLF